MTTFQILKAGIVLVNADGAAPLRITRLQYNPDMLSRTLQPEAVMERGDRSEPVRLTAPPVETLKQDIKTGRAR